MKVISVIVVAVVIVIHAISGFYDFSSITTKEIKNNYNAFVKKSLKLKQVRILGYKTHQLKEGVLLELDVYNGYVKFFKPKPPKTEQLLKQSIKVRARVGKESKFLREIVDGRDRIPEIQIRVQPKFILLEKYRIALVESWLVLPYQFSLVIFNTFLPLNVSILIAMVIQIVIIAVIIILIIDGIIYVFPKLD